MTSTEKLYRTERDNLASRLRDVIDSIGAPDQYQAISAARSALAAISGHGSVTADSFGSFRNVPAYEYNGR